MYTYIQWYAVYMCVCMYVCIHRYSGIIAIEKKNENFPFATTWVGLEGFFFLEGIMLGKVRERQILWTSLTRDEQHVQHRK